MAARNNFLILACVVAVAVNAFASLLHSEVDPRSASGHACCGVATGVGTDAALRAVGHHGHTQHDCSSCPLCQQPSHARALAGTGSAHAPAALETLTRPLPRAPRSVARRVDLSCATPRAPPALS